MKILIKILKKYKIFIAAGGAVVIIVGLVLGLTLGGSESGQTPGKKVMTDTRAYLMEMSRLLGERAGLDNPELCCCCDAQLVNGVCPYCGQSCDQSYDSGASSRLNLFASAPVNEVESSSGGSAPDTSGGCDCH